MITIINGDLLKATDRDIILHQVNCKGVMGGGIAKQIHLIYPDLYYKYFKHCEKNEHLLGTVFYYKLPQYIIANCFGQDGYGRGKQYTDYEALKKCLAEVSVLAKECKEKTGEDFKIGIPYKIGCGLGGGDWNIVYKMICEVFEGLDVVIYRKDCSMKLNNRTTGLRNGYICELTKELDKLANLTDETFFRHYMLVYDYHRKQRCFPIRVPGGTVGNVWVDDDDAITKIVIETNYVIKTYPKNINELIQRFVGTVIEY